jgi:replication factor C large subunit
LATYLRTVAEKEDIPLNEQRIEQIIENVNGDVRAGLNDLESLTSEQRDTQINVFEVVRTIFKKTDYKKIRESVFNSSVDYDLLLLWIMENIPNEYEKKSDVADAFYYLSRADIFRGRIVRQQYWGYLRYVSDLMSCGVASAKKEPYYKFVKYSFPHYLSLMAKTKSSRSTIKSICKKIGAQTHDSIRDTQKELWLYSLMIKNKYNLNELYGLEKEEIEILKKI